MGFQNGLYAFTAAVLGGIGNIPGAVLGGIVIGAGRSLGSGYVGERVERGADLRHPDRHPDLPAERPARRPHPGEGMSAAAVHSRYWHWLRASSSFAVVPFLPGTEPRSTASSSLPLFIYARPGPRPERRPRLHRPASTSASPRSSASGRTRPASSPSRSSRSSRVSSSRSLAAAVAAAAIGVRHHRPDAAAPRRLPRPGHDGVRPDRGVT